MSHQFPKEMVVTLEQKGREIDLIDAGYAQLLMDDGNRLRKELIEAKRRIETALDLIDGREDVVDNSEGTAADTPNLEMRIGMALRGEDRP